MAIELLTPFTKVELEQETKPNNRPQVGILAGTFNPIHNGHLVVADQVRQQLDLDEVLLMPEILPVYAEKEAQVDDLDRVEMMKLALAGISQLKIETSELECRQFRYTYDTVQALKAKQPETDFYLIIGADLVDTLPKWHRIDELMQEVQFVGVQRPRYRVGTSYPIIWVDVPQLDVSSSMIRDFVQKGRVPNFLLPHEVLDYIEEKGLYL